MKYKLLLNILDKIREEAPKDMKRYMPKESESEKINNARARAYIHLYLKVKFGILDFEERESLITDDCFDGGIDAYYIDKDKKIVYLIQSKFRTNQKNFEEKSIKLDELLKMEITPITKGESLDYDGNEYNSKIKKMQNKLQDIKDIARYDYKIIILANLVKYKDENIKKVIDGYPYEVFNFERTYNELVYPMCTSTYYDEKDIELVIDLNEKNIEELNETFITSFGECDVTIVFLPVDAIGKAMNKYKNSILKYNPRNYLSLSKNKVNGTIRKSIVENDYNDFAILNNGITILCDEYSSTNKTGKKNKSQVIISNPQFINGGQTAYTLSKIYNDIKYREKLNNKKVMLKLITISSDEEKKDEKKYGEYLKFIQSISDSTNKQTKVEEADRRSNDQFQINLQKKIYSEYGYLYERKKGEFETAISEKYIDKDMVIDRSILIRSFSAFSGKVSFARTTSGDKLFNKLVFDNIFTDINDYKNIMFSYIIFKNISKLEKIYKKENYNESSWGNALRYGKYALVGACKEIYINDIEDDFKDIYNLNKKAEILVNKCLMKWKNFEWYIQNKSNNEKYFGNDKKDFDNYYKGNTLDDDIKEFFNSDKIFIEACVTK